MIKKYLYTLLFIAAGFFAGCEDRTELTEPAAQNPNRGQVDLTKFVSIGNSITAGYQSGSLFQSAQEFSFPSQIAKQVGTTFVQPLVGDPGTLGRIEIVSLSPFATQYNSTSGTPLNIGYSLPYNNLGVPGALLVDILKATSSGTSASGNNPMFDLILRGSGTVFQQARLLQPTFITLWIGNNDVLGFATSGGVRPTSPTPATAFAFLYSQLADSIASLGAKVVVANIPDVLAIPFFRTVGPQMAMLIPWRTPGLPGMFYQKHGESAGTTYIDSIGLLTGTVVVPLTGSSYAPLLGQATGKFYRDNHYPALPPGIDTTKPFGFHPTNPWPDALILDADEIVTARTATTSFNETISTVAQAKGWGLVDFYSLLNNIAASTFTGGTKYNGVTFTSMLVTGGLFSLDGVHPSSQGHAIIANEFIKVLNTKWDANIPLINVAEVPGSLYFAKQNINKYLYPEYRNMNWNNLLF